MEIIKNIGAVIGTITALIGLLALLIKPFKKKFDIWLESVDEKFKIVNNNLETITQENKKQSEMISKSIDSQRQILRSDLTNLYEKSMKRGYLTFFEHKNMLMEFNTYSNELNGNSFVCDIVEEMRKLPVRDIEN